MRALSLVVAIVLLVLSVAPALANGTPIKIPLTRIPAIVNFGSDSATGLAEITAVEGDVIVTTDGMLRLTNELYQAWLVNTRSGERISVGKFNVTGDGSSRTHVIANLGNNEYDLFVITVEPEPDPLASPDDRIVLAGYWPGRGPQGAGEGGTPAASPRDPSTGPGTVPAAGTIVSTQQPTGLPRTGGIPGIGVLLGALGGVTVGLLALGGRRRS